jgi:uncharacterized protein (UPF0261 family)
MQKTIVLLGTLDTKGIEFGYIRDKILKQDCHAVVIDAGILGKPLTKPEITREQVAQAAGTTLEDIVSIGDEEKAITLMSKGATAIVQALYQSGRLDGILSLGGTMGTFLATGAMRALPLGVPKVMVSTVAAWDTSMYLGTKDITMIPPVTDILGLNRITKRILTNAAGAIVGMVGVDPGPLLSEKPLIAITLHGDMMPCLSKAKEVLEGKGYEVIVFPAIGTGGQAMEELIEEGLINGVFDMVTHELMCNLFGKVCDAGPHRLEAAGKRGIPQVVSLGRAEAISLDMARSMPEEWKGRKVWMHTPYKGVVHATKDEMALFGKALAEKLNRATGPAAVIIPLRGFTSRDREGDEWHEPESNLALIESLKQNLEPKIGIVEVDAHINDASFAEKAAILLDELMRQAG